MDDAHYYLHSDGHLYRIDGKGFRRIDKVTGEEKLSKRWMLAAAIALWAVSAIPVYLIWHAWHTGAVQ